MDRDDDTLPEKLRTDLHGLLPGIPASMGQRDRQIMDLAHEVIARSAGRRRWYWAGAAAAAAAAVMLVTAGLVWQAHQERSVGVVVMRESRPTIVDALIAAKGGAGSTDVDQIAMTAVRLDRQVR